MMFFVGTILLIGANNDLEIVETEQAESTFQVRPENVLFRPIDCKPVTLIYKVSGVEKKEKFEGCFVSDPRSSAHPLELDLKKN